MRKSTPTRRPWIAGVLLVLLSLALLQFDRRGQAPGPIGRAVVAALAPLQGVTTSAGHAVRGVWLDYADLRDVREDNKALQAKLRALQAQAAQAADLQAENDRLRRLLDLGDRRKDLRLRAAKVVARSTSAYFRVLSLELEVGDGAITEGMPVIAPGGVVGQVRTLTGSRAEVLLVTDPRSAIDVVLEKSRARGVAVGTGEQDRYAAKLEYLQRSVKAVGGERVLTTGDDGRYPRGLVVGEVAAVGGDVSGPFQNATVRPLVDLGALDEVFIVLGPTGLTADGKDYEAPEP
ncbi:MAG: rod shape-determining protein MreC [Myxococcales bacterium]|nr:rod shape-determining protein MreC [Myxococcales bacterium]MCB9538650.1 rod shape-determining protein MreC [Myxococcales bacterium]